VGGGIDRFSFATLTVSGSTFRGNQALAGAGGAGAGVVPSGLGVGGGIDDSFTSTATVMTSAFNGNQAAGGAGGTGQGGGSGLGGGIAVGLDALLGSADGSVLALRGTTLYYDVAEGGPGGGGGNGGDGQGGGLAVFSGSSATASESAIVHNVALGGFAGSGGATVRASAAFITRGRSPRKPPASSPATTPRPATTTSSPSTNQQRRPGITHGRPSAPSRNARGRSSQLKVVRAVRLPDAEAEP
jgi:hypothetical protein